MNTQEQLWAKVAIFTRVQLYQGRLWIFLLDPSKSWSIHQITAATWGKVHKRRPLSKREFRKGTIRITSCTYEITIKLVCQKKLIDVLTVFSVVPFLLPCRQNPLFNIKSPFQTPLPKCYYQYSVVGSILQISQPYSNQCSGQIMPAPWIQKAIYSLFPWPIQNGSFLMGKTWLPEWGLHILPSWKMYDVVFECSLDWMQDDGVAEKGNP